MKVKHLPGSNNHNLEPWLKKNKKPQQWLNVLVFFLGAGGGRGMRRTATGY
jgi:hypothetical protein